MKKDPEKEREILVYKSIYRCIMAGLLTTGNDNSSPRKDLNVYTSHADKKIKAIDTDLR